MASKFLLFAFFLYYSSICIAGSGNVCEVSDLSTAEANINKRSKKIVTPEGFEIIVVGTFHGSPNELQSNLIHLGSKEEVNGKEFETEVVRLINENSKSEKDKESNTSLEVENHEVENYDYLATYLTEHSKEQTFVGIEHLPELLEPLQLNTNKFEISTYQLFNQKKSSNASLRKDLVKAIVGGAAYLSQFKPYLFNNAQLLGIEGKARREVNENKSLSFNYFQTIYAQLNSIIKRSKLPKSSVAELGKILKLISKKYPEAIKNKEEYIKKISELFQGKDKVEVERIIREDLFPILEQAQKRDKEVASKAFEQNKSGVIFFGQAHLDSIMNELKAICDSRLNKDVESQEPKANR